LAGLHGGNARGAGPVDVGGRTMFPVIIIGCLRVFTLPDDDKIGAEGAGLRVRPVMESDYHAQASIMSELRCSRLPRGHHGPNACVRPATTSTKQELVPAPVHCAYASPFGHCIASIAAPGLMAVFRQSNPIR